MRTLHWVVVASVALVTSCSRAKPTGIVYAVRSPRATIARKDGQIAFFAPITPATAADFEKLVTPSVKTLVIRSAGGNSRAAIQMAETIHHLGIRVLVSQACRSACAQYSFVAGRERRIAPDSLVVFRNTSSAIARLGAEHRIPGSGVWQAFVDREAKRERQLYGQLSVSSDLLYEPQIMIHTRCVHYVRDSKGRVRDLAFKSTDIGWVPSRQTMAKWGVTFSGFWPTNAQTFKRVVFKVFRHNRPFQIILSSKDVSLSVKALSVAYSKIGICKGPIPPSFESHAPAWSNPYATHGGG